MSFGLSMSPVSSRVSRRVAVLDQSLTSLCSIHTKTPTTQHLMDGYSVFSVFSHRLQCSAIVRVINCSLISNVHTLTPSILLQHTLRRRRFPCLYPTCHPLIHDRPASILRSTSLTTTSEIPRCPRLVGWKTLHFLMFGNSGIRLVSGSNS